MSKAEDLLNKIESIEGASQVNESVFTIKRIRAIRGGKATVVKKRVYAGTQGKEGFKRDPKTGTLVRMTALEMRKRKRAAKRAWRRADTRRNHEISNRRHDQLIPDKKSSNS